jgi:hypothetical protein
MATKTKTIARATNIGTSVTTWAGLQNGDAGEQSQDTPWTRAFFMVTGNFGATGSVQIEGSNDGTNWFKLSPAALTAAGLFAALGFTERPWLVRPRVTAGDANTSLVVTAHFV